MKLTLGTAQFGFDYGLTNKTGQVSAIEAKKIVKMCEKAGIFSYDTANTYGDSEKILGLLLGPEAKLTTKLRPNLENNEVRGWIHHSLNKSLNALKVKNIDTLMSHRSSDILRSPPNLINSIISDLKYQGIIRSFGASLYQIEEVLPLIENYNVDVIQFPLSLMDQRFLKAGILQKLKGQGCEIEVRSIFLQGLLLLKASEIPQYFSKWKELWETFEKWQLKYNYTALEACITFANSFELIDRIVIGVQSSQQFQEVLNAFKKEIPATFPNIHSPDQNLTIPSNW